MSIYFFFKIFFLRGLYGGVVVQNLLSGVCELDVRAISQFSRKLVVSGVLQMTEQLLLNRGAFISVTINHVDSDYEHNAVNICDWLIKYDKSSGIKKGTMMVL